MGTTEGNTFRYADIKPITSYITPQKQAAKRHYGSHQYFTKRAWNVVQSYIQHFTRPGDVVCDPYGGTGVTVIEALACGRKGIYVDISSWAKFLAEQIAVAPIDLDQLLDEFSTVEARCADTIHDWWMMGEDEVCKVPLTRWYPQADRLPKNADVVFVHELFTHRQLLALSELHYWVHRTADPVCRDLLRYAFSATLYMCNRTFISAEGRKESRGGSSIFSIYRYKVAKRPVELDPWEVFKARFRRLLAAKRETNQVIGVRGRSSENGRFIKGYAQRLCEYVDPESVDYIFTDPPYGAHIAYLDLTRMWDAWLGFHTSETDRQEETIEAGDAEHSTHHFKEKLSEGIGQMFKVLKYDRWLSLVFAHREPAMWDTIVKAAEGAGFEYVNTVAQPLNVIWSMHKKKNPLTVFSGELILNFRKVRNPRTLAISTVGSGAVGLIKDSAELTIVHHNGATTDQIYHDIIPKLLENGLLGEVSSKIGDLTPILSQEFDHDETNQLWQVRPGRKLGCHIPLHERIRFYITDFLNQTARLGRRATLDDIVMAVLPKLKNGVQPTQQSIVEELRKIAEPTEGRFWTLRFEPQQAFEFARPLLIHAGQVVVPEKPASAYEHNELLSMLTQVGLEAGFACHVGKREQSASWNGKLLGDLSVNSLTFLHGASSFTRENVVQVDLLWLDANLPAMAFEIEHSTSMTSALDRFLELLRVAPHCAERLFIVAPESRQRKLNKTLGTSHYIGAPMYLETKVRYLWYSDVLRVLRRFGSEQPTKTSLVQAIMSASKLPKAQRA